MNLYDETEGIEEFRKAVSKAGMLMPVSYVDAVWYALDRAFHKWVQATED